MEDKVESLRRVYEAFRRGEVDPLTVRDEAMLILKEVKEKLDPEILEELEDMLIDVEFSIEENRCRCHPKGSIY